MAAQLKVAIIIYSMYGHIAQLAEAEAEGVRKAGGVPTIYQIPETLPEDVLTKMHAPAKHPYTVLDDVNTLKEYNAFLFGIPTRYGNFPAQWKTFIDRTGSLWQNGELAGKYAGIFVSTGTQGGGQETTASNALSTLVHHGIVFVPFGYSHDFATMTDMSEVRGGSAWGAGTFAGAMGERVPSTNELKLARTQGETFTTLVRKVNF
jgi:NAD(P)H dehydrogenase (quinone)